MTKLCPHCMQPMPGERLAKDQPDEARTPLTPNELVIWDELRRYEGRVVTTEALCSRVTHVHTDEAGTSPEVLRLYILKIRRKLKPVALILNEWGRGYKLVIRQEERV